jgi:hypothetical protein
VFCAGEEGGCVCWGGGVVDVVLVRSLVSRCWVGGGGGAAGDVFTEGGRGRGEEQGKGGGTLMRWLKMGSKSS